MSDSNYWVYILRCKNNSFYTGYTNNLVKRFKAHLDGKASKYTRSFKPIEIVFSFQTTNKSLAMKIEHCIKTLSRIEKEKLITYPKRLEKHLSTFI